MYSSVVINKKSIKSSSLNRNKSEKKIMLHTQIILDTLLIGSFLLIPKQEPHCLWRPTWMASRESIKLLDPIQIFGSVNRTVTLWVCPAQHLDSTWRLLRVFTEDFILCPCRFPVWQACGLILCFRSQTNYNYKLVILSPPPHSEFMKLKNMSSHLETLRSTSGLFTTY